MNFDSECQDAINLAKRAVGPDGELDARTLLVALLLGTNLKDRFPHVAGHLSPLAVNASMPEQVRLSAPLRPIFTKLANSPQPVRAADLLVEVLEHGDGRRILTDQGMENGQIESILTALRPRHAWRQSPERAAAVTSLRDYGRMLTDLALPDRGIAEMERPIHALVQTLSKMRRRNALVIGYAGTGKSALVHELARRIVEGHSSIPEKLRDLDIFELSPAFLRAGASFVGQYEDRVKRLIEVLQNNPKIILFVDEIHSLFQSGMHVRGPFTEANESFKGVLSRGDITCIGCTTVAEYRHYIQPDGALERRFSIIRLEPPSRVATIRILQAKRPRMEAYFSPLRVPDALLERAVELTDDYIPTRYQPDKSIQLLDEACARCVTDHPEARELIDECLLQALEDVVGHRIVRSERLTEAGVYDRLSAKIIGQDDILHEVAQALVAGLGSWRPAKGPRGVFLFAGPTGVGKTEVSLLLAEILGGGKDALLRVDCNTLQGSGHDGGPVINRLLGVPAGYVGYARGQGGLLSKIRDLPEAVVLFDEFEKADPTVGELLLRIIDEGRTEDVDGNLLDFRRSFIILTTNAGATYDAAKLLGFGGGGDPTSSPHADPQAVKAALRATGLGEEFLGRIGRTFLFHGLDANSIRTIIVRQLEGLRQTADIRGLALDWDADLVEYLAQQWQPRFGVRHLTIILRNRIIEQLSVAEAHGELANATAIRLRVLNVRGEGVPDHLTGLATREHTNQTLFISLA